MVNPVTTVIATQIVKAADTATRPTGLDATVGFPIGLNRTENIAEGPRSIH